MRDQPNYLRVFLTFARNSLVRDMTFRWNFIVDAVASLTWVLMNLGFYLLVFEYTRAIAGWNKFEFLAFIATTMIVNSLVQTFFMPNASEFSELIRTGNLDFALLKPIDTQFLISLQKIEWSSLSNFAFGAMLLIYSLGELGFQPGLWHWLLYPIFVLCGVAILYSLTIAMSSVSVWLGRNQSLYDFWFYITNFSRYPREIYRGELGDPLQFTFTYVIPILIVVNVPARLLAKPFDAENAPLALFAVVASVGCVLASRALFQRALGAYRSASS